MSLGDEITVEVPLAWISEALDEIWELRQLVAYEAQIRKADLGYATYPKGRRKVAEDRIKALQLAARGKADVANAGTSYLSFRHALKEAGADDGLTRSSWEAEKPRLAHLQDQRAAEFQDRHRRA